MTKHNDQGIGDTVEATSWSFHPTKDGGNLVVKGPYETQVVRLTGNQLKDHLSQHETTNVLETARENRALRELGNTVRYNPDRKQEEVERER